MKLITRLLMLVVGSCLDLIVPTLTTAAATTQPEAIADKLHTPAQGSAEREAILGGVRRDWRGSRNPDDGKTCRGKITFHVSYLKAHNGWAWVYADPRSS